MRRFFAFYPPGRIFQRGEERCQSNIKYSTATAIRACNDLGYVVAVMRNCGWKVFLRDYQSEGVSESDLLHDFDEFAPDVIFVSVTNATLKEDSVLVSRLKERDKDLIVILKGAIFYNPPAKLLKSEYVASADYLIAEDAELVIGTLLCKPDANPREGGDYYYRKDGEFIHSQGCNENFPLDELPFPARDLMNNKLYVRPDTGKPMATIFTSRGCPSQCIFCLTPLMSGHHVRFRSPENIIAEIKECVTEYGISEFFFRSDTFTINKEWTLAVCRGLTDSGLSDQIRWCANSRAKPLDEETLAAMKKAGCWLVAIGFESGSDETLKLAGKGTTVKDNIQAAAMVHAARLKLYGFYLVGFPWENASHLKQTLALIWKTRPDFLELHIATPFYGTELYRIAQAEKLIQTDVVSCDYFEKTPFGTMFLSAEVIQAFRQKTIRSYIFRLPYIWKRGCEALSSPTKFLYYWQYALHNLKNLF